MNNQVNWLQQGWECPKCGAVMSPHTNCCVNCRGNKGGYITTTTDPTKIDVDWTKQQASTAPSSICSTGSSKSVVYGKEDPEKQWERYQLNV